MFTFQPNQVVRYRSSYLASLRGGASLRDQHITGRVLKSVQSTGRLGEEVCVTWADGFTGWVQASALEVYTPTAATMKG